MSGTQVSRRTFLAGAAIAALGNPAFASGPQASVVSVGLVGCGGEGMRLLRELGRCRARVPVLYDAVEQRKCGAALLHGADAAPDWRTVIERGDVDAVAVATPTHLHAPIAIAAMEAGKDVYCTSPMALGLDDARALRECAARTGRAVQIGAEPAGETQWQTARALIRAGVIGDVAWCQGRYRPHTSGRSLPSGAVGRVDWDAFSPGMPRDRNRLVQWRHYWDYSAGTAVESHFDELAGLLSAVGATFPVRVSAAGGVYAEDARETPDSFVMSAEYRSGITIVLASTTRATSATIRGSKGSLELCGTQVRVVRDTKEGPVVETRAVDPAPTLVEDWLAAIRTRREGGVPLVACSADLGYCTMVATAMAIEAYRQRKTFRFAAPHGVIVADTPASLLRA